MAPAKKPEISLVILDQIEWIDTDSQLRIDQSSEHVDDLAGILKELDEHAVETAKKLGGNVNYDHPFPPIVLFTSGGIGARYYIGDGYHRFHAYEKAGREAIRAEVTVCEEPKFEAFRHALGSNAKHGLPRSNADKRNAVRRALACEKLQGLSIREIAKLCGVVHQTVANIQSEDRKPQVANLATPTTTIPHEADTPSPPPPTIRIATPREHAETPVEQAEPKTSNAAAPEQSGPKDKLKLPVPENLLAAFENSQRLRQSRLNLEAEFNEWKQWIGELGMLPGTDHFIRFSEHAAALKAIVDDLKAAEYHTHCPDCGTTGKVSGKQCKTCMGPGFLCGPQYDCLSPASKKKLSA